MKGALAALAERWQDEASGYERDRAMVEGHLLLRRLVDEMREAWHEDQREPVTVAEASALSGFSRSHLYHCIEDGTLPNAGRRGTPRIRRRDLPRKPGTRPQGLIPLERAAILADLDKT